MAAAIPMDGSISVGLMKSVNEIGSNCVILKRSKAEIEIDRRGLVA